MEARKVSEVLQDTSGNVRKYIELQKEYMKLEAAEYMVRLVTMLIRRTIFLMLAVSIFLLSSIGLGFYLGELLEATHLGFFIVCGMYAVIWLLVYLLRGPLITTPVFRQVIQEMFDEEETSNAKEEEQHENKSA